jgi:hypothetical protein
MKPTARLRVWVDTDDGSDPVLFDDFYFKNERVRDEVAEYLKASDLYCAEDIWDVIEEYTEEHNINYYTSNDAFERPNKINTEEFTF